MRSSLLFDLALMGQLLSQKESVSTARQFALETATDEGAKSFLKGLPEKNLTEAFEMMKDQSIEWKVLYHATRIGEKNGKLPVAWIAAGAMLMLRESLGDKKAPSDSDKVFFLSLCPYLDESALGEINWKKWSRDTGWHEMQIKNYPAANADEMLSWFRARASKSVELSSSLRGKLKNDQAVKLLTAFASCLEGFKDSLDL